MTSAARRKSFRLLRRPGAGRLVAPRPVLIPALDRSPRIARIVDFDDRLLRTICSFRSAPITFMLRTLCRLLDPDMVAMWMIPLVLGGALHVAERLTIALSITSLLVIIVKRTVKRARPSSEVQALVPPDRFSFPSGHTAGAFALALALFGVMPVLVPLFIVLAIVVGYARMYLGVHYPIDVAAGAAVGLFIGSLVALL